MTDEAESKTPAPISKTLGKVGDPGQPSVKAWDEEIKSDFRVALSKIEQSPQSAYARLARIIRANLG